MVLIGRTKHCFLNKDNKPIILKKDFPEFDKKLKNLTMNKETNYEKSIEK